MKLYQNIKPFLLRTKLVYSLLFLLCMAIFTLHYLTAEMAVYGDGIDYYAYLHTVYFDQDIDFKNEFQHFYTYEANNYTNLQANYIMKTRILPNGKVDNIHPPGPAFFWFPFFLLGDVLTVVANALGLPLMRNGYSNFYQFAVGAGSILSMLLGLLVAEINVKHILARQPSWKQAYSVLIRIAVLSIFFSTSLFYYGAIDVINSHAIAFLLTQLFFYLLFVSSWDGVKKYAALGVVLGAAIMTRPQDNLLFFMFLYITFFSLNDKNWLRRSRRMVLPMLLVIVTTLLTVFPMLYVWHVLYGGWFVYGYELEASLNNPLASLFHPMNGLFTRTPVLLISLFALPLLYKNQRMLATGLLLFFVLNVLVITRHGGWILPAYGGRMYIVTFLLFMLLLAYVLLSLFQKKHMVLFWLIIFVFPLSNVLSIFSFMAFEKEAFGNTRGIEGTTKERLEKVLPPPLQQLLQL